MSAIILIVKRNNSMTFSRQFDNHVHISFHIQHILEYNSTPKLEKEKDECQYLIINIFALFNPINLLRILLLNKTKIKINALENTGDKFTFLSNL